jgi:hypothetical protein
MRVRGIPHGSVHFSPEEQEELLSSISGKWSIKPILDGSEGYGYRGPVRYTNAMVSGNGEVTLTGGLTEGAMQTRCA